MLLFFGGGGEHFNVEVFDSFVPECVVDELQRLKRIRVGMGACGDVKLTLEANPNIFIRENLIANAVTKKKHSDIRSSVSIALFA